MALLGLLIFIFSFFALIAGLISIIGGAINGEKERIKRGIRRLLIGSLSLLVSFSLCSIS